MALYSLTYDLVKIKDYERLYEAIIALSNNRYTRPTKSQWIIQSNKSAVQIIDILKGSVDGDDILFIIKIDATQWEWASWNLGTVAANWMKASFT